MSRRIPIVFAYDNRLAIPAAVAMHSLFAHAAPDTDYDVYVLHAADERPDSEAVMRVREAVGHHSVTYLPVPDTFAGAYEVRGISVATYYRLFIPDLLPDYDKVIYADVDMIFRSDLTAVYDTDLTDKYLAGVYDWHIVLNEEGHRYIRHTLGLDRDTYLQAGFLVMNLAKMRADGVAERFRQLATGRKLKFQDQDILNLVCGHAHVLLPPQWNMTDYTFYYALKRPGAISAYYPDVDLPDVFAPCSTLHFNGMKPWQAYSVNYDVWCRYYRDSAVYDPRRHYIFYYNRYNPLDKLSLFKRIKVLIRYFVFGREKNEF